MTGSDDDRELLARLRAADPAGRAPRPSAAWIDDLTEATMDRSTTRTPRHRMLLAAAAVVALGLVGYGGVQLLGGDDERSGTSAVGSPSAGPSNPPEAAPVEIDVPGETGARCMPVTAGVLATMGTAFEGTVTALDGREATVSISRWYAGTPAQRRADQARLTSATDSMTSLIGALQFEEGKRYLISANDGQLSVCGFSAAWNRSLADTYDAAFGQ